MRNFFHHILYLHWIGFAAIVLIIEILAGTGFLLWIGISAVLVSIILFIFPVFSFGVQLIVFALLSVLSSFAWKFYLHHYPIQTDRPTLNRRGEQYVGRVFVIEYPIVNGMGTTHVDDTMWRVRCPVDLPVGAKIRITGADGVILLAEPCA